MVVSSRRYPDIFNDNDIRAEPAGSSRLIAAFSRGFGR